VGPRGGLDGRKISSPPEFDPRPPDRVAQSLYRLSYPAHIIINIYYNYIATELWAGRSGGDKLFRPSRPALGPTQPPVKWKPGLSRG